MFLFFLGIMCNGMSEQYDRILQAMTETVGISEVITINHLVAFCSHIPFLSHGPIQELD